MRDERVLLTFARAHTNARVALNEGSGGSGAKKGCDKKVGVQDTRQKGKERAKRKSERNRRSLKGADCYILPPLRPSSVSEAEDKKERRKARMSRSERKEREKKLWMLSFLRGTSCGWIVL